jgi:hypothetical protein
MKKSPLKINKKKLIVGSAAAVATLALIVGTLLPSASDVVSLDKTAAPPAVVLNLDEEVVDQSQEAAAESKKSQRLAEKLRAWLLGLPQAVRIIFVLPLWALGWLLSWGLSTLWAGLFSPALGFVASWVVGAAVLAGIFTATAKVLFPELSLKKILTKKNGYFIIGAALIIVSLEAILPFYWPDYNLVSVLVKTFLSISVVGFLCYRIKKKYSAILS